METSAMQHVRARSFKVVAIAGGILLLGTSASFAQCMAGGGAIGSAGAGMMGGPRMMGMGTGAASAGASMMSLQQAMQAAQMVQQMQAMQMERMRMIQAQRNRQAAGQPRSQRNRSRQATSARANRNPVGEADNIPNLRNRRTAANRGN
jgi:hypothetical protein